MNIAVKGSQARVESLNERLSLAGFSFTKVESTQNIHKAHYDVIFDLNFDDNTEGLKDYILLDEQCLLILSSIKIQLESVLPKSLWNQTIGINSLNSFLNRESLEYCSLSENFDVKRLSVLPWEKQFRCASRVGLVSARVVCMIINEAYYTLEEGTANRTDINLGLKLGTAYPHGPFEWAEIIGIKDVYETLLALYQDTLDERYKICSTLKTDYLISQAK